MMTSQRDQKEGIIHASYGCEGYLADYELKYVMHLSLSGGHSHRLGTGKGDISACPSLRGDYIQEISMMILDSLE